MKMYKKLILGTVLGSCLAMPVMGMKGVKFDKEVRFDEKICDDFIQKHEKELILAECVPEMLKAEIKQRWNNSDNIDYYNEKILKKVINKKTYSIYCSFRKQFKEKCKNINDEDREWVLGHAYDMYKDTMRYSLMEYVAGSEKSKEIFLTDLKEIYESSERGKNYIRYYYMNKRECFHRQVQKILSWRFKYCILFVKNKINEWSSDINTWCRSVRCSGIKVPDEMFSLVKKYAQGELYKLEEFVYEYYKSTLEDIIKSYEEEVIINKMKDLMGVVIDEWKEQETNNALYEISNNTEKKLELNERIDTRPLEKWADRSYDYTKADVFIEMLPIIDKVYKDLTWYASIQGRLLWEYGVKFNHDFKWNIEKYILESVKDKDLELDRKLFYELIREGLSNVECDPEEQDAKDMLRNISLGRLLTVSNIFTKEILEVVPECNIEVIFDNNLSKNDVEYFLYHIKWAKFKLNEALARFGLKIYYANIKNIDSFMAKISFGNAKESAVKKMVDKFKKIENIIMTKIFFGDAKKGTVKEIDDKLKEIKNSTIENLGNVLGFETVGDYFDLEVDFNQVCDFKNKFQIAYIVNFVINKNLYEYCSWNYRDELAEINDKKYTEFTETELYSEIVRDLKVASELDPPMTYRDFYEKVRKNELRTYLSNILLSMIEDVKDNLSKIENDRINQSDIEALRKEIEEDKNYINKYYTRLKRYTERNDRRLVAYINCMSMLNLYKNRCSSKVEEIEEDWLGKCYDTEYEASAINKEMLFSKEITYLLNEYVISYDNASVGWDLKKLIKENNETINTLRGIQEELPVVKSLCEEKLKAILKKYATEEKCRLLLNETFGANSCWIITYNMLDEEEKALGESELTVGLREKFSYEIFDRLDKADWIESFISTVDKDSLSKDGAYMVVCKKMMQYTWLRILSRYTMMAYDKYKSSIEAGQFEEASNGLKRCVAGYTYERFSENGELKDSKLFNKFAVYDKNSRFVGGVKVTGVKFVKNKLEMKKKIIYVYPKPAVSCWLFFYKFFI